MQPDEIYLANFQFGDTGGMKLRPALLLTGSLGTVPEVLVAYIASVIPTPLLGSDIVLDPRTTPHESTNLKTKSVVRLHKLATIHKSSVVRRLGARSSEADQKSMSSSKIFLPSNLSSGSYASQFCH